MIVRLITTSQHHRLGAKNQIDEILNHDWFNDIDLESIKDQTFPSPIYDIVTAEANIQKLTEVSNNRFTQYWKKKTEKALKIISKKYIDDGENFKNEFSNFVTVNVKEEMNYNNHRDSVMVMRRHTMSSIRRHRENSVTDSVFSGSVDGDEAESPLENFLSPNRKSLLSPTRDSPPTPKSAIKLGDQSGIVVSGKNPHKDDIAK